MVPLPRSVAQERYSSRLRIRRGSLPLEKAVHVAVKADLLAVEIACIVEKAAVQQIERQEDEGGCQGAEPTVSQNLSCFCPSIRGEE